MSQRLLYTYPNRDIVKKSSIYGVDITANLIKFKITSTKEYPGAFDIVTGNTGDPVLEQYDEINVEIPLSAVKKLRRLKSNSLIGLTPHQLYSNRTVGGEALTLLSELSSTLRIKNTFSNRVQPQGSEPAFLQIFVRDVEGTFEDWDIIVFAPQFDTPEQFQMITNAEWVSGDLDNWDHLSLLDTIQVVRDDTYTDAEYVKFNVTTPTYHEFVYLEQVFGIIDRVRVAIDAQGNGSFRVLKSSVIAGDKFRVRAGFLTYPALTDLETTL